MTDRDLRELERAFKESNSPDDELAWLRERVRQGESLDWESYSRLAELNVEAASEYLLGRVKRGDLEREKLELAAYCSHEPARVALGEEVQEQSPGSLVDFIDRLKTWGRMVSVRAALLIAETEAKAISLDGFHQQVLLQCWQWVHCPCSVCETELQQAAMQCSGGIATSVFWAEAAIMNDHPIRTAWCAKRGAETAMLAVAEGDLRLAITTVLSVWALGSTPA